jgi:hypothetical protein
VIFSPIRNTHTAHEETFYTASFTAVSELNCSPYTFKFTCLISSQWRWRKVTNNFRKFQFITTQYFILTYYDNYSRSTGNSVQWNQSESEVGRRSQENAPKKIQGILQNLFQFCIALYLIHFLSLTFWVRRILIYGWSFYEYKFIYSFSTLNAVRYLSRK